MKKSIQRIIFISALGLAITQLAACDDVKRIFDSCTSSTEEGSTNVDCKP